MREPFRISSGEVIRKEAILLRLGDGAYHGWGESSAMGGDFYSSETPEGCESELVNSVLPAVLNREFPSMLALEEDLVRLTGNRFVRGAVWKPQHGSLWRNAVISVCGSYSGFRTDRYPPALSSESIPMLRSYRMRYAVTILTNMAG
jgi:hypothetical protein